MSKRPSPPPEEGEGWLVSYADMMTLIACFFILMMAFANYDPVGFNDKATEFSKSFGNKSSEISMTEIKEEISRHELKDRMKISMKSGELIVTFSSSILYADGQSRLSPDTLETLDALIDILRLSNANYRILIEGHADDILAGTRYDSQWALSLARSAEVVRRFEYFGFPATNIVPIGRGDSQKVVSSTDGKGARVEENARLNRRVVIRVLEPYEKKKLKFGLGIYFRDATEDVDENMVGEQDLKEFDVQ
jgi:chemotaxis protein MotB